MEYTIVILALLLSAFFSGMEIAFISANRLRIEIDRKQSPFYDRVIGRFLRAPGQYISTMLVGNNIALVVYSLFMSSIVAGAMGGANLLVETLISTVIIIFTAEFLPKALVRSSPNWYLKILIAPIYLFYWLFYPVARFTTLLSVGILRIFGLKLSRTSDISSFDKVDLQSLVEETSSDPPGDATASDEADLKLLQNALDFSELKVRDCMVPRVDVVAVEIASTPAEILDLFKKTHFSRIPLYEGSVENIVGYASGRDLFSLPESLDKMRLDILFTPETGSAQKLLQEFIKSRKSMAVVIDEFGTTAGIVTIEDILEQIVGEIEDEHDQDYTLEKVLTPGEKWLFSARLEIEYLNEEYDLAIPLSDEYDTLAGYLLYNCENFPQPGEQMVVGELNFRIKRATSNKITLIELSKLVK